MININNQPQILRKIAETVQTLINAETVSIALAESDGEIVYYAAAVGKHAHFLEDKRGNSATSGLCGVAFQSNNSVLVCSTEADNRVRQDYVQALGIKTALAVPLNYQGKLLGAIMVLNRNDDNLFNDEDEQTLVNYAPEAAALIANL